MGSIHATYMNTTGEVMNPVILLSTCKGKMLIPVWQIIRIQSMSNYCKLFFHNASPATGWAKTLVVAKLLRWFEELPQLSSFIRIHRTHLINTNYIKTYHDGNAGMLLNNGEKFSVAWRKRARLKDRLNILTHSSEETFFYTSALISNKVMTA